MKVTLNQAFDVDAFHAKYDATEPKSYQAIMIEAPRKTVPRLTGVKEQNCINITFAPLGDEKNKYRKTGTRARVVTAFETTNRDLYIDAVELFEIAKKLPVEDIAGRSRLYRQLIRDNVKSFEFQSKLFYNPTDREGNVLDNLRTGEKIKTNNHSFFIMDSEMTSRALSAEFSRIETWLQPDEGDTGFDPLSGTTSEEVIEDPKKAADAQKAAEDLAKLEKEATN